MRGAIDFVLFFSLFQIVFMFHKICTLHPSNSISPFYYLNVQTFACNYYRERERESMDLGIKEQAIIYFVNFVLIIS